jgi:hypothetical protein
MPSLIKPLSNTFNLLVTGNTVANATCVLVSSNSASVTTVIVANSSGSNLFSFLLPATQMVRVQKNATDLILVSTNNTASATKIAFTN